MLRYAQTDEKSDIVCTQRREGVWTREEDNRIVEEQGKHFPLICLNY